MFVAGSAAFFDTFVGTVFGPFVATFFVTSLSAAMGAFSFDLPS
ncbi:hypothetical protein RR42_m3988 [Cupriavidus basilensis]|uniref:Uncharacterized protein n=1 Tax=Cupriavidus basilensis TaxID=68895 RepID=A0A0C4YES1_9BURK|nr:hypothetical protein RR42_m3988 [Cupriavidus basilensis]